MVFLLGFFRNCGMLWESPSELSRIIHIDIFLIPKMKKLEHTNHYRPFPLCNVIYKEVNKSIVERLKGNMSRLVSLNQ